MSIRKRFLTSYIAMIIIPIVALLFLEMILGIVLIYFLKMDIDGDLHKIFVPLRFIGLALILILTNGLLTYFVSKSVLRPVEKLSKAAERISDGDFDSPIKPMGDDELGQLAETFELMRLKLKESAELQFKYEQNRKELIANISHDLKTPITSIKGYVEGLRDGVANTPEKMDRYIQTIYSKTIDMNHLIDELFLFSKLDLNSVPFHFQEVNLLTYFRDLIEELQYDLKGNEMKISLNVDEEKDFIVSVDREQLKRISTNIIQNSVKHMGKSYKEIIVHLEADLDEVKVHFQDNGVGITEEALPYIFEQFYKADPSRPSSEGSSGLGLAIVKRIVNQHGGAVWAESKEKWGRVFTLHFHVLRKRRWANEQHFNNRR